MLDIEHQNQIVCEISGACHRIACAFEQMASGPITELAQLRSQLQAVEKERDELKGQSTAYALVGSRAVV
jgi:hypothetical protein